MKTKVYRLSNPFREIRLATSRVACLLNTPTGVLKVERIEAANAIRYARVKGSVSLIK